MSRIPNTKYHYEHAKGDFAAGMVESSEYTKLDLLIDHDN